MTATLVGMVVEDVDQDLLHSHRRIRGERFRNDDVTMTVSRLLFRALSVRPATVSFFLAVASCSITTDTKRKQGKQVDNNDDGGGTG